MIITAAPSRSYAIEHMKQASGSIEGITKLIDLAGPDLEVNPAWGHFFRETVAADIQIGADHFASTGGAQDAVIGTWLSTRARDAAVLGEEFEAAYDANEVVGDHPDWASRLTSIRTDLIEAVRLLKQRD